MASLNKVFLMGNLTRDPELRYTPGGAAVVDLGLAVNREYTSRDGQKMNDVCYVDVVAWSATAENCSKYLSKGSPVFIEGRLQLDSWPDDRLAGAGRLFGRCCEPRWFFLESTAGQRLVAKCGSSRRGPRPSAAHRGRAV